MVAHGFPGSSCESVAESGGEEEREAQEGFGGWDAWGGWVGVLIRRRMFIVVMNWCGRRLGALSDSHVPQYVA
jgi:hypothetical protein